MIDFFFRSLLKFSFALLVSAGSKIRYLFQEFAAWKFFLWSHAEIKPKSKISGQIPQSCTARFFQKRKVPFTQPLFNRKNFACKRRLHWKVGGVVLSVTILINRNSLKTKIATKLVPFRCLISFFSLTTGFIFPKIICNQKTEEFQQTFRLKCHVFYVCVRLLIVQNFQMVRLVKIYLDYQT